MSKILQVALFASLAGCIPQYETDTTQVIAAEAAKLRGVQIGMTIADVDKLMGTSPIVFTSYLGGQVDQTQEARPIRTDKFKSKDGKAITIVYYRSSRKKQDGVCTDDETTAVVFVDGKVEALVPGETSKEVIEVRLR